MSTERIEALLQLMESHELAELELEEGDFKVRLAKRVSGADLPMVVAPGGGAAPAAAASAAEPEVDPNLKPVESPIVGTFYRAPAPDAASFVDVGDTVDEDTVVCIVEAMKVMNEVRAGMRGTVAQVLVENGEPVEYGQPLFLVRP